MHRKKKWMRKTLASSLLALSLSYSSFAIAGDAWSERDKYLEATYLTLHVVDWLQTKDIAARQGYYEMNPILGRHPSQSMVDLYFIGTGLAHVGLIHVLPKEYRPWVQGGTIALEIGCIGHNYSAGVKWRF
jgi:hypothetical protein